MKRNKFSLGHYKLLTMDMGNLIPISWFEVLPGDTVQQRTSSLIRCSPLLAPVMHPVRCRIHHFYVCLRDIWDDFEDFITGGPDGTSVPTHPYISSAAITEGSLHDYMGVPVDAAYSPNLEYSALPFRAQAKIYNEFYRDQDLVTELTVDTTSGQDTTTDVGINKVAWEKDRLTTTRPWATKGNTITIPLVAGEAPVLGIGPTAGATFTGSQNILQSDGTTYSPNDVSSNSLYYRESATHAGYPGIEADLTGASGVNINNLRWSLALQRYQEARAQYGSRYSEYLRYLGVDVGDRTEEAEYLGGGRQTISFSEVLATDGANTGDMYGHGISALRTNRYRKFFKEHGIVMTFMSVVPKAIYTHALHKKFSRTVKEDYFVRELQTTGEQEIYNKEVYAPHATPDGIFGYQARYDSYRSHPSDVHSEFLSTLDHWHYGRIFASDPALNQTFTDCTPTKRVNASSGTDCLYVLANHSIQARRAMLKYAKSKTF